MNVWWSQTMVQGVGWTLLHFLWQGLVIAALLAIGLRLLRRGPASHRYLAGCAALLLMALAPLVTFQLVLKQDEPPPVPVAEPPVADAPAPAERTITPNVTLPKIVVTATREPRPQKASWRLESLMPWLVAAWLIGVGGLSCRLFAGWLQIRRLRRADAEALADGWPDKLAELARRLGVNRPLRLLRTAFVEVPTVIGWLRPVILLPASCLTGLTPAQLESIIAHELAHIRRHDYLINLLQSAVETLLFYHPAVWWVSRRIREERENCCDDLVVEVCGDRVGYARALATLEELRPASAPLALAASGAPLLQRIRRVLGQGERSAGRPAWPLAGVLVVILLALTAAGLRGHRAVAANEGQAVTPVAKRATNSEAVNSFSFTNLHGSMESEGYSNPGQFVPQATLPEGSTITAVLPLPHFRPGQFVTTATPWSAAKPGDLTNVDTNLVYRDPWGNAYIVDGPNMLDRASSAGGSNMVVSTNALIQVDEEWKATQRTNLMYTGKGRQTIQDKLNRIRVDTVNYADLPLKEVLHDLSKIARDRDPDGKGINFFFSREAASRGNTPSPAIDPATGLPVGGTPPGQTDVSGVKVNITLNDVRLADVLEAITKTSDSPIKYSLLDFGVMFSLRGNEPVPLETRTFHVDPNTFIQGLESVTGKTLGGGGEPAVTGVNVAPGGGGTGGSAGGVGGVGGGGGLRFVTTDEARANIQAAARLYFTAAGMDLSTNLGKVVIYNERKGTLTVRATPQDLGVIEAAVLKLNTSPPQTDSGTNSAQTRPGSNGQPADASADKSLVSYYGAAGTAAVNGAIQTLNSTASLTNQSATLETRTFRVDPNIFRKGLESARAFRLTSDGQRVVQPAATSTNKSAPMEEQIRELFRKAGVDSDGRTIVVWNENRGALTVRATPQDLDLIEAVIQSLNTSPPQVNIKARFVEITMNDRGAPGFQWFLGGSVIGNFTNQSGTNGSGNGGVAAFPGAVNSVTLNSVPATGSGSQTNAPRLATVTGILTDPQFRTVLQALEQRDGVDILTTPEVTTESGRQAQIQSVDIQSIVEMNTNTNTWQGTNFTVKQLPFGPMLDIIPYVSADEFSVRMILLPSVTEFLGYDDPGQFVPQMLVTNGSKVTTITSVLPLPHFRLRQISTEVTVWDGQTVVIGGFGPVESISRTTDKVPVLGSIPLVGGLFRSEHVSRTKKELMVFITPTIINPDGTRYHKDEEMPFAKSSFPPQAVTNAPPKK